MYTHTPKSNHEKKNSVSGISGVTFKPPPQSRLMYTQLLSRHKFNDSSTYSNIMPIKNMTLDEFKHRPTLPNKGVTPVPRIKYILLAHPFYYYQSEKKEEKRNGKGGK